MSKLPMPPRRNPFYAERQSADEGGAEPSDRGAGPGTQVLVRLQPDLLARLDRARGGKTRPEHVRTILEQQLPK